MYIVDLANFIGRTFASGNMFNIVALCFAILMTFGMCICSFAFILVSIVDLHRSYKKNEKK